jgi:hypothetical protein
MGRCIAGGYGMNREDIIKLARESGLAYGSDEKPLGSVTRFAALVAAEKEKQIIDILRRLQERNDSHNYYGYAIKVIAGEI